MFKSIVFKKQLKKVLKEEGHSLTSSVMIRLKSSKERDYLLDLK